VVLFNTVKKGKKKEGRGQGKKEHVTAEKKSKKKTH